MNWIVTALKSRTIWTIAAMFLVGGLNAVLAFIPAGAVPFVQGALALLATYYHLNPSQQYGE